MPVSFIDEKLKKREADILYQVKIAGRTGYFYLLFEHQSTPDIKMPLRAGRYVISIQEQHMDEFKTNQAPYVFPIVFYNGKSFYPYATDIREMVSAPDELLTDYGVARFHLVDLNTIEDNELRNSTWDGLSMYAMKHAYDRDQETTMVWMIKSLELLSMILPLAVYLTRQEQLLKYIMYGYPKLDEGVIMRHIQESRSEIVKKAGLTVAEQLKARGREEGLQQGSEESRIATEKNIVNNMLHSGLSAEKISELTGISLQKIKTYVVVLED